MKLGCLISVSLTLSRLLAGSLTPGRANEHLRQSLSTADSTLFSRRVCLDSRRRELLWATTLSARSESVTYAPRGTGCKKFVRRN